MTSTPLSKKKLNEYTLEDLKYFFYGLMRKVSSKVILIEIGNEFFNIAIASYKNHKLSIRKVFRQNLPKEALDKSIPTDPEAFSSLLNGVLNQLKFRAERVAILLPSDTSYTRLIEIPENVDDTSAKEFIEDPDSNVQIPIAINNSDFDVSLTSLPKKLNNKQFFNRFFLTSIPKKNLDIFLETTKLSNLELCSLQISHMSIATLLRSEIIKLDSNNLIISLDLLDEFTQFIIMDSSGPIFIKRLGSIRKYPTIEEMKDINIDNKENSKKQKNKNTYLPLSELDLRVLIREIKSSFSKFLTSNELNKNGIIYLTGRNSQHDNLVETLGKALSMDVNLISPLGSSKLSEFNYNPDEINQFSMSRLVGLGLSLINEEEYLVDNKESNNFIIKTYKEEKKEEKKVIKKDTPKENQLPPLPNIDLGKSKEEKKESELNKKVNQKNNLKKRSDGFKMDTSFLDLD